MNCKEYKKSINDLFDENRLSDITSELQEHLETCSDCFSHFERLHHLDVGISDIENLELPEEIYQSTRDILLKRSAAGGRHPEKEIIFPWRWIAGAAALLLIFASLWFLPLFNGEDIHPDLTADTPLHFQWAKVENQEATAVIYQSGNTSQPLIIWLYK